MYEKMTILHSQNQHIMAQKPNQKRKTQPYSLESVAVATTNAPEQTARPTATTPGELTALAGCSQPVELRASRKTGEVTLTALQESLLCFSQLLSFDNGHCRRSSATSQHNYGLINLDSRSLGQPQ